MKVEDIDVSLRYGKLLNKGWIIFSYIVLGLLTLLLSYCVYDTYSSTRNIIDILYIAFSFVLIFAAYIWIILKYKMIRKKLKECLKDAVELTAYSKEVFRINVIPPQISIKVYFKYDGIRYEIPNGKGRKIQTAYYLLKYGNRKIRIYFSPTYKEVMILKDQSII